MPESPQHGRREERRNRSRRVRDVFDSFPVDQQAEIRRDLDRRRGMRRAADRAAADTHSSGAPGMTAAAAPDPSRPTVLVIDDVEATRAGLAELLRLRGYNAIQAANGAEGLDLLQAHSEIQAIILDLAMPQFDGRWFRERQLQDAARADVPVIVFTGSSVSSTVIRELHVTEVMTKPFSVDRLFERLEKYCVSSHRH
jgi:CheY-like chemotaxis protein